MNDDFDVALECTTALLVLARAREAKGESETAEAFLSACVTLASAQLLRQHANLRAVFAEAQQLAETPACAEELRRMWANAESVRVH